MTEIIERLTQDYGNFSKILTALEKQVQVIEHGRNPDVDLMVEIMDYVRNYVNVFQYPREELIFKKIMARDENARPTMKELIQDHQKELKLSLELAEEIDGTFLVDEVHPRAPIAGLAREFIEFNRRHLDKAQNAAFPLAAKVLDDKDWKEIIEELPDKKLPEFEELWEQEYKALYEHLQGMEGALNE